MALQVGIHKNLVLVETKKNDKGNLSIKLRQAIENDPMAVLNSGSLGSFEKQEAVLSFMTPLVEYGGKKKEEQKILDEINDFRNQLTHILQQYMTSDKIKWNITFGLGLTSVEQIKARITVQDTVNKIYNNLVDQFIDQVKPFAGASSKKLNWKFIRSSKAKNYPALPKKYLETYPFVEDASVPVSKLKYSKFEIDEGYNVPDAVNGTQQVSQDDSQKAAALFASN